MAQRDRVGFPVAIGFIELLYCIHSINRLVQCHVRELLVLVPVDLKDKCKASLNNSDPKLDGQMNQRVT